MQSTVKLLSFKLNQSNLDNASEESAKAVFEISHNDGVATLRQNLVLQLEHATNKWTASMSFDNFDQQSTPQDAALKLAGWMKRLSEAIESGEFNNVDLSKSNIPF